MKDNYIIDFLRRLAANNNREWFAEHKEEYLKVKDMVDDVAVRFIAEVAKVDPRAERFVPRDVTYRIYRDTRFSSDKTPYKTHIGLFVNPPFGRKSDTGGYYLHLEPGNCLICGGTWCLPSDILRRIRQDIYDNFDEFGEIVESPEFRRLFPKVGEDLLKTAPKGFPKDWEHIEYLKPRIYAVEARLPDAFLNEASLDILAPYLQQIKRFNDFLNYSILPEE